LEGAEFLQVPPQEATIVETKDILRAQKNIFQCHYFLVQSVEMQQIIDPKYSKQEKTATSSLV